MKLTEYVVTALNNSPELFEPFITDRRLCTTVTATQSVYALFQRKHTNCTVEITKITREKITYEQI